MALTGGANQLRQVFFDVTSLSKEYRDNPDGLRACGRERSHGFVKRRPHQLEVGNSDEKVLRKLCGDALEWARPIRIARAVGEQDDAFFQCSVARRPS